MLVKPSEVEVVIPPKPFNKLVDDVDTQLRKTWQYFEQRKVAVKLQGTECDVAETIAAIIQKEMTDAGWIVSPTGIFATKCTGGSRTGVISWTVELPKKHQELRSHIPY